MKLIVLLITTLSLSATTTYGQQADSTKQWTKNYIQLGVGLKDQKHITNFDRWDPYISTAIISMDEEEQRGRFISIGVSGSNATFDQRFQIAGPDTTCLFCRVDTIGRVNSDVLAIDLMLGKILPLKSWGDHHRLSLLPTVGYAYHQSAVDYLDEATSRNNFTSQAHSLLGTVDIQYRYIVSDKITLAATANLMRITMRIERDETTIAGETVNTSVLDLDMTLAATVVSLAASVRI